MRISEREVPVVDERSTRVTGEPLLRLEGVVGGYGGFDILHGVDLEVHPGEIVCIVGPNGSGKSTVFKATYGLISMRSGSVYFRGADVTGSRPEDLLRSGMAMVPQLSTVFPDMTVYDNLELGMYVEKDRSRIASRIDDIFDLFPRLAERRSQHAGSLSGGERRALEIGRSLMLDPTMVLMDEPSVGLSPKIVGEVFDQIIELRDTAGITFLMVEQNARSALAIADRGYVIERGRATHTGTGRELLEDPEVRRAFLGG
jgi:ABC-type branched-subunit amino acid transport system ATPase component